MAGVIGGGGLGDLLIRNIRVQLYLLFREVI